MAVKNGDAYGLADIILGKQRHGPTGTVKVEFEGIYTKFKDLAKISINFSFSYKIIKIYLIYSHAFVAIYKKLITDFSKISLFFLSILIVFSLYQSKILI